MGDEKRRCWIEKLVYFLSKGLHVTEADWQIGPSKIFLRRELSEKLERLARLRVHAAARTFMVARIFDIRLLENLRVALTSKVSSLECGS
jgi:hypothetical protein